MTLSPADRERIRAAFRERIGPLALPSSATIDDLCANLLLAIPALLETCEEMSTEANTARKKLNAAVLEAGLDHSRMMEMRARIATLTAQLEADPCP